MNGETRDPQLPDDDDIPTLTEIVVPGRLRAQSAAADGTGQAPPEFVFDIAFAPTDLRGEQSYDSRAQAPAVEPDSEPAFDFPGQASSPVQDAELPLPWADQSPPEPVQTQAAAPPVQPHETQPPIITPDTTSAATIDSPDPDRDPDAQALLRALLADIGNGLEQRLQAELALTEQRLRAAVREELDTRLRELLAGAPPTV